MTSLIRCALRRTNRDLWTMCPLLGAWIRDVLSWRFVCGLINRAKSNIRISLIWDVVKAAFPVCVYSVIMVTTTIVTAIGSIGIMNACIVVCGNFIIGFLVAIPGCLFYFGVVITFGANYLDCFEERWHS
jgi:hypothetical protein